MTDPRTSVGYPTPRFPAYEPRQVRSQGLRAVQGWTMKLYSVAVRVRAPAQGLTEAAVATAASALPTPPRATGRHGVGFLIVHESAETSYVLVCWWAENNEVHEQVFSAPSGRPDLLRPHDSAAIGCVWELAVTDFERRAWIEHVLKPSGGPNLAGYLAQALETVV